MAIKQPTSEEFQGTLSRPPQLKHWYLLIDNGNGGQAAARGPGESQQPIVRNISLTYVADRAGARGAASEVIPAVTQSMAAQHVSLSLLQETQQLGLYTKQILPDMADELEMLAFTEYAYATTNVLLKVINRKRNRL